MTWIDFVGYLAAFTVLATFCMKRLIPLRVTAIGSNLAFMLYGHLAGIEPVLVLHLILLPVNSVRLMQALSVEEECRPSGAALPRWTRRLVRNSDS